MDKTKSASGRLSSISDADLEDFKRKQFWLLQRYMQRGDLPDLPKPMLPEDLMGVTQVLGLGNEDTRRSWGNIPPFPETFERPVSAKWYPAQDRITVKYKK